MELDKGPRAMEVIHSYPSPQNGWRQELITMMIIIAVRYFAFTSQNGKNGKYLFSNLIIAMSSLCHTAAYFAI